MSCSIPSAWQRPSQFLTLEERRRREEVPGLLLDHPVGIPTSPWDSLAIWSHLYTPPPSEHTSCQNILERTESNNQANVFLSFVPGPLSGKLRNPAPGTPAEVPGCAVLGSSPAKPLGHS